METAGPKIAQTGVIQVRSGPSIVIVSAGSGDELVSFAPFSPRRDKRVPPFRHSHARRSRSGILPLFLIHQERGWKPRLLYPGPVTLAQRRAARSSFACAIWEDGDAAEPRRLAAGRPSEHARSEFSASRALYFRARSGGRRASGVIINRPLDKQVADLVNEAPPEGLADVPVFLGGPVGQESTDVRRVRMAERARV